MYMYSCIHVQLLCCINIFVYACVYSYILCVWVARCMSVCRCVATVTLKDNVAFACVLATECVAFRLTG